MNLADLKNTDPRWVKGFTQDQRDREMFLEPGLEKLETVQKEYNKHCLPSLSPHKSSLLRANH